MLTFSQFQVPSSRVDRLFTWPPLHLVTRLKRAFLRFLDLVNIHVLARAPGACGPSPRESLFCVLHSMHVTCVLASVVRGQDCPVLLDSDRDSTACCHVLSRPGLA